MAAIQTGHASRRTFPGRPFHFLLLGCAILLAVRSVLALVPPGCVGSHSVGSFRLLVKSPKGGPQLAVRSVNILEPGLKLKYEPLRLAPSIRDKAKIAVLLVPASDSSAKEDAEVKEKGKGKEKEKDKDIVVLEARPAKEAAEWEVPVRASVVGVVFGPTGLSVKKVSSLVEKNPDLIPELAEYAQQTETVQALVETLSEYEKSPDTGRDLNAALKGFSTQYDLTLPKLDTHAPADQQASQLLRAVIPSLSSYDPLASERTAVVQQSAGLAASVAGLFFGMPVGLAAGGTALFANLHSLTSPDTDFRSAFAVPTGTDGLALCSKTEGTKSRTRIAYLWLMRVPNTPPPSASLAGTTNVPMNGKPVLKADCAKSADLKLLPRAREWQLVSSTQHADVPVKVEVAPSTDSLELDLSHTKLPAGAYQLAALWDWEPFKLAGNVMLRPLPDLSKAKLTEDSEDHLVEGGGTVEVQLTGADFEFVDKVALVKAGDRKGPPKELSFTLPKGKAEGEQPSMTAEVDTSAFDPGSYRLLLTQENGATGEIPLTIHPPNPRIEELPLRVNAGEPKQTLTLRGTGLERLASITSAGATWQLDPAPSGTRGLTERKATVKLLPTAHQGELLAASLSVDGIHAPLEISDALRVAGPRPKIAGVNASFARQPGAELREGEIPAGSPASFAFRTENLGYGATLALTCANEGFTKQALALHPGDKTGPAQLEFAGDGLLFLSLDPGVVGQSGCVLTSTVETPDAGRSDPYTLGRLITLPYIEKFTLTDEKLGNALYAGILSGQDLQTIEKTGWDAKAGYPVQGIPTPVPGSLSDQTLKVALPWPPPSPRAPLYVWLRGETEGRMTHARY